VAWASDPNPKITIDVWRESVWVKTSEQAIECCATEGKEFAYVKQAAIAVPAEFIFPARQASLLCDALLTGAEGVTLSGNWVGTDSKQFRVAIKLAEGKFIPIQYILQQKARPIGVFQICRLVDTLQTVKALGRGEPWMEVRIHLDPAVDATQLAHSRVTYTGTNNNFERSLPHDLVGEPCKFKVDCERAIRVFGHVQPGAMASLGDGMVIFKDGDYTYTLALLRDTE
jgi:hypothetical protein